MTEPSGRSLRLSPTQLKNADIALAKFGSKSDLAAELKMSRTTINNFFKGEPVQRKQFLCICKKLKLKWEPDDEQVQDKGKPTNSPLDPPLESLKDDIDALVQQVRSRLHDDIQRLHSTMPLWGVDRWVPLGDLFVDVNILEELSSSRKSELDDLWQDFRQNLTYRSLDRIGLGKERKRVSGLEVLAKNANMMVVGKPGAGKTTYLQRVVTECNAGNLQARRIPILIRLRDFVKDGHDVAYSLKPYLEKCWQLSDAETLLKQGRALVLLDGLDEVMREDGKNIAKEIKRFARTYPQVQVIVTCRTQSQESRFERFDYVEVADFNESQVRSFSEHWFKTVMGDESAGLVKAREFLEQLFLDANKPIRELTITPILLSLTCAVFHQTGKFYSKRSKLYEEGLELLLEQWDKSREIDRDEIYRDLSVQRKLELLSFLAVKKFEQKQYVLFEQVEIEGYIAKFLGIDRRDSRVVLRAMEAQHGLLIERSQKIWSFSHLTFQEYLVAKWFCDYSTSWEDFTTHILDRHWREVFLLTIEIVNNPEEILCLLKTDIDFCLSYENKLQEFLSWLVKKDRLVHTSLKPASIRAFYFGMEFALPEQSAPDIGFKTRLVSKLEDMPESLHPLEYECDDIAIDFCLANMIANSENGFIDPDFAMPEYSEALEADYLRELTKIIEEVPDFFIARNCFDTWQEQYALSWLDKYRSLAIKYRHIGYDWQFTYEHKEILERYYDANIVLMDCLDINSCISNHFKREIEEELLLPIAEIEKRKREKAE